MQTAGLYIHFPFCVKKCNYCDFLSFPVEDSSDKNVFSSYISCVENEMCFRKSLLTDTVITSVFFGGGTPSLMTPEMITGLMAHIRGLFSLAGDAEITMECNPGTLSPEKLCAMRVAGVNRLSIGLQSAHDDELRMLGRIHTYKQFLDNYQLARGMGFDNINVDLMSALPGQTIGKYRETLLRVLALAPEHISAYSLIIEDGTPFAKKLPAPLPDEDADREMYDLTGQLLRAYGYERYELSNYARPGFACRHNIGCWTRQDYLGIGLGSASLIGQARFSNIRDLEKYLQLWSAQDHTGMPDGETQAHPEMPGIERFEYLIPKASMEEFMFLGLRMSAGISPEVFEKVFKTSLDSIYHEAIATHLSDGTLIFDDGRLRLTPRGRDVANVVMADFLL